MHIDYLGDSYDLVKRFWAECPRDVAPLWAYPFFVPDDIRVAYTALTKIEILDLDRLPQEPFGLLLDPDTGIPLPDESDSKATRFHAPLPFIAKVNEELRPLYMICFDQSYHRLHKLNLDKYEQLERKRQSLQFNQVRIDPEVHTLVWPNSADFDPATLHDWPRVAEVLAARARQWELTHA